MTASLIVFIPVFKSVFCGGQHSLRAVEAFSLHEAGTVLDFTNANSFFCHNILLIKFATFAYKEHERRSVSRPKKGKNCNRELGERDESIIPIFGTSVVSFQSKFRAEERKVSVQSRRLWMAGFFAEFFHLVKCSKLAM